MSLHLALIGGLLLGFGNAPHPAQPASASDLAEFDQGFAQVQSSTRTFRAEVTQTLHLQGLAHPIVSTGTLSYERPDHLLIRFSHPAGEWMLVNGSQVEIQKQGKPLERQDLSTQGRESSHAATLLDFFHADPERWHQDFDVSIIRNGGELTVHLKPWMTPTSTSQGVQEIVTRLQLPGYDLLGMRVTISPGNVIEYQFTQAQRNVALDPALFQVP